MWHRTEVPGGGDCQARACRHGVRIVFDQPPSLWPPRLLSSLRPRESTGGSSHAL